MEYESVRQLAAIGVSRREAEAYIGRKLTEEERIAYDAGRADAKLAKAGKLPQSGAARKAKVVASHNDVGEIPAIRHRRVREACRYNLELYGWIYCRRLLDHRASATIRDKFIQRLQEAILHGGQFAVAYTRGAGKTTWMVIAIEWASVYGHCRYPVVVAATAALARNIVKTVWTHIENSEELLADFPAIALPIRALGGVSQRAASQTYHKRPTGIETGAKHVRFPLLRTDAGAPLDDGSGVIIGCVGVGGSIRGLLDMGVRPDLVLFDDPQKKTDAASASRVKWIEDFIHKDALGLAGHNRTISAFVTITPQKYDDVACRIMSKELHPEWNVSVQRFVDKWDARGERLIPEFVEAYHIDVANDDFTRANSRAWYVAHKELFAGTITIDPLAYDREREEDSIHHALNLYARMGREAFEIECQMKVAAEESELHLTTDGVAGCLNGTPEWVCPPGTNSVVAFCDVNIKTGEGLSYCAVAFGRGRVGGVIGYGRYPKTGALVPPGASDLARKRAVAKAIRVVTNEIRRQRIRDTQGRTVDVVAMGFDRGYLPDTVCRSLFVMRRRGIVIEEIGADGKKQKSVVPVPFPLLAVRGVGGPDDEEQRRGKDVLRVGDHVMARKSEKYGNYLEVFTPYWKEIARSGLLEVPLMPGSVSLWGSDAGRHWEFAQEICAERLALKYLNPRGRMVWDWKVYGPNHWGDAFSNCFALASWYRLYDATAQIVDRAARSPLEADLFDPRVNTEIQKNAAETPAPWEKPLPSETAQRVAGVPAAAKRPPQRKFRFRKGRWKR